MYRLFSSFCVLLLAITVSAGRVISAELTIIHSNDLHSYLLGFSPNIDYDPRVTGNDDTLGGWARIATVINNVKKERKNPVLVIDGGDFLMGTLFHTISREHALELRLLYEMGYDAMVIGNHEFDLMPAGLARILNSAHRNGKMPVPLLSNAIFSEESPKDDELEKVFQRGIARKYTVIERGGIKIGIFGLLGHEAATYSPFAAPVKFADNVETAKEMVKLLREEKNAQVVICLSHSGLSSYSGKLSEDERLAKEVNGIDIIVSGHSHTLTPEPIIMNDTIIVQAWEYGKRIGVLDVTVENGRARMKNYQYITIDDTIPGDMRIHSMINEYIQVVEKEFLSRYNLKFNQVVAETSFDLVYAEEDRELTIGNLVADATRWYANKHVYDKNDPDSRVSIAIESNGLLRASLLKGKTGKAAVCDIFNTFPMGIGFGKDDSMGYPIVSLYVTAAEVKKALEVLTSVAPLKGNSYFLQVSGLKFSYNPNRLIFDRVTGIWLGDAESGYEPLDYSARNPKLFRVAANIYNATFLKIIGGFTFNMLEIIPKDREGKPIQDLTEAIIYGERGKEGLKQWVAIIEYMKTFPDTTGNGIPNIPAMYENPEGRIMMQASWNPVSLVSGGNWLTWTVFIIVLALLSGVGGLGYFIANKVKKRKS